MPTSVLKAYVLDDEFKAIELLRTYISRIDFLELDGAARDPMEAFKYLQDHTVDILFLDINMPVMNGVELYKNLDYPPLVIFTTAYPKYAVDGFDLEAVDFLLKPISFARFLKSTERLLKRKQSNTGLHKIDDHGDVVYVKSGSTAHKLLWKDILYLEKDENYVIYYTETQKILSRQTLSKLEEVFPNYLCRVHKSFAVSFLHITSYDRQSCIIGDKVIPIGRSYKDNFKMKFKEFQYL